MNFFKRPYIVRRYLQPKNVRGYISIPYTDMTLPMDIQTMEDAVITAEDGARSVQQLKVFCDNELLVEDKEKQQKADRVWFQGKWFDCQSSRLSENTPLRHWTATFVQCLDHDRAPGAAGGDNTPDTDRNKE